MKRIITEPKEAIAQFVARGIDGHSADIGKYAAIGLEQDGKLIAGVVYYGLNGNCITASIHGIGNWPTREFLWYMFHYPFVEVGVKRITATVETCNEKSHNFVKHLGFTPEATLQLAGRHGDIHIYRMFPQDCKWLKELSHGIRR